MVTSDSKKKGILIFILLAAFIFRIQNITNKPFFFDEKASIGCAMGIPYAGINQVFSSKWVDLKLAPEFTPSDFAKYNTISNVYRSTLEDNGSILYFSTLHYWIKYMGFSKYSVRFLSVIFSLFTVLMLYFVALEFTQSNKVALLSSFILAVHPLAITSAQFCRSHAMAGFFALSATLVLISLVKKMQLNLKYVVLYGLSCCLAMLCHYFTMYVFLGHFVVLACFLRTRIQWVNFLVGGGVGVVLFSVWLINGGLEGLSIVSTVHDQFLSIAQNWKPGDNPYYIPSNFRNVAGGWAQTLLPLFGNYFQNMGFRLSEIMWMILIPFAVIIQMLYRKKISVTENKKLIILSLIIVTQPIWATLISFKMGYMIFFQPSYAQYVAPYCAVFIAYVLWMGSEKISNRIIVPITIVQLIVILVSDYSVLYPSNIEKDFHHEQITKEIEQNYQSGDLVVYSDWNDAFLFSIHLKNKTIPQKVEVVTNKPRSISLIRNGTKLLHEQL